MARVLRILCFVLAFSERLVEGPDRADTRYDDRMCYLYLLL